jgi:tetratricopeptide (TPR) repeat protein
MVESLEEWAKTQLQNGHEEAQWNFVVGLSLSIRDLHNHALPRLQRSLELRPDFWRAEIEFATSTGEVGNRIEAIDLLTKALEKHADLLDVNANYAERYWDDLLPILISWNESEKQYAEAEVISRKLFDHGLQHSTMYTSDFEVICIELLRILQRQQKYASTIDVLQQLSEKIYDHEYSWMSDFLVNSVDDARIMAWLIAATAHTNTQEKLLQYLGDIDKLVNRQNSWYNQSRAPGLTIWIQGGMQTLRTHFDPKVNSEEVLNTLESLARKEPPAAEVECDFSFLVGARKEALKELRTRLLTFALRDAPENPWSSPYTDRLRSIYEMSNELVSQMAVARSVQLARACFLSDKISESRDRLRNAVSVLLQIIRERCLSTPDTSQGIESDPDDRNIVENSAVALAAAFMAINDDENALAAWSLSTWVRREQKPEDDIATPHSVKSATCGSGSPQREFTKVIDTISVPKRGSEEDNYALPANDNIQTSSGAQQQPEVAVVEVEISSPGSAMLDKKPTLPHIDTSNSFHSNPRSLGNSPYITIFPENPESPPYIMLKEEERERVYSWEWDCDGLCGHNFDHPSDLFYCRDCIDLYLCRTCHEQLKAGTLVTKACDILHSHLYVPPFKCNGEFYVSGTRTSLEEWLDRMLKEWDVEEQSRSMRTRMNNARRKILRAANAKGALELAREESQDGSE